MNESYPLLHSNLISLGAVGFTIGNLCLIDQIKIYLKIENIFQYCIVSFEAILLVDIAKM